MKSAQPHRRRPSMPMAARLILWHRSVGILLLPVMIMLAVTGLLINHSQSLGWYEKPVYARWIGALYGIPPRQTDQGFKAGTVWVSQVGDEIHFNQQGIEHCSSTLLGAVSWQDNIVVLCDQRAQLRTNEGQLIENLPELPTNATGLSNQNDQLWLFLSNSQPQWLDDNSWSWQAAVDATPATAVAPQLLPADLKSSLNQDQPLPGISRERFLLDLHSGRLFGDFGVLVVDAASLLLVFLAASGAWSWLRRRLHRQGNNSTRRPRN